MVDDYKSRAGDRRDFVARYQYELEYLVLEAIREGRRRQQQGIQGDSYSG